MGHQREKDFRWRAQNSQDNDEVKQEAVGRWQQYVQRGEWEMGLQTLAVRPWEACQFKESELYFSGIETH